MQTLIDRGLRVWLFPGGIHPRIRYDLSVHIMRMPMVYMADNDGELRYLDLMIELSNVSSLREADLIL
ncbi:MAG: hypothetical protein EB075_12010 [Bacteroidetes bacterium]|nr:hypothetical protein [Bacteroidota bacterium]